ncbi:MAG: hypothetical protein QM589_13305 [Thermomicrobiales bacterium]
MAHTITITNPHTIAIIERGAAERGLTPVEAVDLVFADRHPDKSGAASGKEETPEERAARLERAHHIIHEIQSMMTDEDRAFDYDAWLYDENGLPH